MTKRKAAPEGESQHPDLAAFFADAPSYPTLQAAADAYYGQATTQEQLDAVALYATVEDSSE